MFYDQFKELCDRKNISVTKAAMQIGLSNATPTKWKKTGAMPDTATLVKIADYFGIPAGEFLGDTSEQTKKPSALTEKDKRDISKQIEEMLGDLESEQSGLMFDGEPLDDETRELLAASLRNSMEISKIWAKKKFTPKKYKKDE